MVVYGSSAKQLTRVFFHAVFMRTSRVYRWKMRAILLLMVMRYVQSSIPPV